MTDKPINLPNLINQYKDLTLQIVEINKKRYVLAHKLRELGIKAPGLAYLRPDGVA